MKHYNCTITRQPNWLQVCQAREVQLEPVRLKQVHRLLQWRQVVLEITRIHGRIQAEMYHQLLRHHLLLQLRHLQPFRHHPLSLLQQFYVPLRIR